MPVAEASVRAEPCRRKSPRLVLWCSAGCVRAPPPAGGSHASHVRASEVSRVLRHAADAVPVSPGRSERKLFTHITPDKPRAVVDGLLTNGFRRSQHVAYIPYCSNCQACVSVRVVAADFRPSRGQRRILMRNHDIRAETRPPIPTAEQFALFRHYIDRRHPDGGMADMGVLDFAAHGRGQHDRHRRRRVPAAASVDGDARAPRRRLAAGSPLRRGVDGILVLRSGSRRRARSAPTSSSIRSAASGRRPYLYLGYWVQRSDKMQYKERFRPQEMLTAEGWVTRP